MFLDTTKYCRNYSDFNQEIRNLKGELDDKQARITLAKFLYRNIGFTVNLLTGMELYPDQIIVLKGMLQSNFSLLVMSRGAGKTYIAAIYCILQCIFEPRTSILLAGPTFRTARFIFNHIEKICDSGEAKLLSEAFGIKTKRNDEFRWNINGGEIVAIPLNGEKIRGFRANILLIDEFLLMDETLVEKVLVPYLVVPKDLAKMKRVRDKEDSLIERGLMKEEERTKFDLKSKLIALSSASFQCEYLYRKYDEYVKKIYSDSVDENNARYFVAQMAWDSIPQDRMDKSIIALAQSNAANLGTFQREYGAQFVDGSDSYYSMKKMINATIKDGESPTLLIQGFKERKYILAIDPNFSNSPTSDDFAMCIIEMDEEKAVGGTVVHCYAEHGKDLKDHIKYLYYILKNFNIEMIIIDNAGYQFIESCNENELFVKDKIELKFFDFNSDKSGAEMEEQLKLARNSYNKQMGRIVFSQYFSTDFIRNANEWLQGCIDYKKIWFGSSMKASPEAFDRAIASNLDVSSLISDEQMDKNESALGYFIDTQDVLIKQTKYQAASIEVKTTSKGTQSFDLPTVMKRDNSPTRMRRDSYTVLMLSVWLMKCYTDIKNAPPVDDFTFEPTLI